MNWDVSPRKKNFEIFAMGYVPKIFFAKKYINNVCIDAVFDGDYESAIIFGENIYNIYIKNENRKIRVHFFM
jgi:hypothetical protein